jgi:hypothetical protein
VPKFSEHFSEDALSAGDRPAMVLLYSPGGQMECCVSGPALDGAAAPKFLVHRRPDRSIMVVF